MTPGIAARIESLYQRVKTRIKSLSHEWILFVAWSDLLLASWPVPAEQLQRFVPAGAELDTFDGSAWVSIVPFNAVDMHFHGLPAFPGQADFPELNFRTYVRVGDIRAVLFLSLDCPGKLANLIGGTFFHLPFKEAVMSITPVGDGFKVDSRRIAKGEPPASFVATYRPIGEASTPAAGTLEDFLTNRLSLILPGRDGGLESGEIGHEPWMLQPVEVSIELNTIPQAVGLTLPAVAPHMAFARKTDTVVYPLVRVTV
jgi:hypothetical protein